jgi:hypothetical protein
MGRDHSVVFTSRVGPIGDWKMRARNLHLLVSVMAPSALLFGCLSNDNTTLQPDASFEDAGASFPDGSSNANGQVDGAPPEMDASTPDDAADAQVAPDTSTAPATDLATTPIDFGDQDCGAAPAVQALTFHSTGTAPLAWSASLKSGAAFAIQGSTSGSVNPGDSASITIAPASVTGTPGTAVTDTLVVTTNITGEAPFEVPLSITPQGGSLQLSPATAAFGQTFLNVQAPDIPLTIKNVGTKAVSVAIPAPSDPEFSVTWTGAPAAGSIAPASSLAGAAARFLPATTTAKTSSSTLEVTGPLCDAAAPSLAFSGQGTTLPIAISPGSLSFGTTACGATATPSSLTVTLTNAGANAVSYGSSLKTGKAYTLKSPTGTVPANGKTTISVVPAAVPAAASSLTAGALNDTLTVTTGTGGGGAGATIAITQSATGAVLAVSMPTAGFGNVPVGTPSSLPFSVTNSGNVAAPVSVSTTGAGFTSAFGLASVPSDGAAHPGSVTFTTTPPYGAATGTLQVTTTAPLCQAAQPAGVSLTVTKTGPVAQYSAATLSYQAHCQKPASAAQSVTVTNGGTSPLLLSNVTASAGFTVTGYTTAAIAPGTPGTISVQANTPSSGDKGGDVKSGSVSFTTNEYKSPTHTVPLSATVYGANLGFYSNANGTGPITSMNYLCADLYSVSPPSTAPAEPWWWCPYEGLAYYIFNSGNEAVTLGAATTSATTGFNVNALAAPYTLTGPDNPIPGQSQVVTPGGVLQGSVNNGPNYGDETTGPTTCAAIGLGPNSHTDTVTYAGVAGSEVCVPLPKLTFNEQGQCYAGMK